MNAQTRLSAKGQVVIPKDVRDRLGLKPGDRLDVVETAGGVLLKVSASGEKLSVEEAIARFREIVKYDGPPVSIEDMNFSIGEMWEKSATDSDCKGD